MTAESGEPVSINHDRWQDHLIKRHGEMRNLMLQWVDDLTSSESKPDDLYHIPSGRLDARAIVLHGDLVAVELFEVGDSGWPVVVEGEPVSVVHPVWVDPPPELLAELRAAAQRLVRDGS